MPWLLILGFLNLSLDYEGKPDVGQDSSLLASWEDAWPVDPGTCWKASFMYETLEKSPWSGFYGGK